MPKKRHQSLYSKPQSTAPASLGASASASTTARQFPSSRNLYTWIFFAISPHPQIPPLSIPDLFHTIFKKLTRKPRQTESQRKGVNELLADLRRSSLASSSRTTAASSAATPTVPPALRQILHIPETPPPAPRRVPRFDATGRRVPPGPPPPRSWLNRACSNDSRYTSAHAHAATGAVKGLPGSYEPDKGSLTDLLLRRMALNWDFQRDYDRYYLHTLPSRVRASLVRYVGTWHEAGLSAADLRNIFIPPVVDEEDEGGEQLQLDLEELVSLNNDVYSLDLAGSVGRSMTIRELTDVLFPQQLAGASEEVQDSWDTAEAPSLPPKLLPNITHLSLAVVPGACGSGPGVTWKQLLALAAKLPTLTHLSLAYWPEPSLTPNAKFATIVSPDGRTAQYSSTGAYSHTLDDDWTEAVILLRKLSKCLYGLEYLDLTGCGDWFKALMANVDGDKVDWGGPWGKVSTLKLKYGYEISENTPIADGERFQEAARMARTIERYIVTQRDGKGRFITVERDQIEDVRIPGMT